MRPDVERIARAIVAGLSGEQREVLIARKLSRAGRDFLRDPSPSHRGLAEAIDYGLAVGNPGEFFAVTSLGFRVLRILEETRSNESRESQR